MKMEGLNVQIWKLEIFQQVLIKCCTRCDEVYKETDNISNILWPGFWDGWSVELGSFMALFGFDSLGHVDVGES